MVPRDKLWERLQCLGIRLHLQRVVKAMYTKVCAKVRINCKVMFDIGVKQGCPLLLTLFGLFIVLENIFGRDQWGFSFFN